jgi:hypothetical protein
VDIFCNANPAYTGPTVDIKMKAAIARLVQALCFLVPAAMAQSAAGRLMLWTSAKEPLEPSLLQALRAEIAQLHVPGFSGVDFEDAALGHLSTYDFLVTVDLTGSCDANEERIWDKPEPLGYVVVTSGLIQPRMFVSCRAILHAIRSFVMGQPVRRQSALLARAIVRVIQHELRHILEQTADHLTTGVFKAHLQSKELINQGQ